MGWIADLLSEIPSAARYKIELEQLESDHATLKVENAALKEKVKTCEENLDRANKEIGDLNLVIKGLKNQDQKKYEKETENILRQFFDTGNDLSINDFLASFSNTNVIQYHFDILLKDKMITATAVGIRPAFSRGSGRLTTYSLTSIGREYVVKNMNI